MENEQKLTVIIDSEENITVAELKNFLEAINNQFEKRCKIDGKTDKLLIKEVRKGSIEIEMIAAYAAGFFSDVGTLVSLFDNIKLAIEWLRTKAGDKPKMDLEDLDDCKKLVTLASNHDGTQVTMKNDILDNYGTVINNYGTLYLNTDEAKILNKNINEELASLQKNKNADNEETSNLHKGVILKLIQIKDDVNDNKNTKGIIEDIDKKAHPIVSDENVKDTLLHSKDNPFNKYYLVNVKANKVNGKLSAYIILNVLDSYYPEEADSGLFKQ